MFLNVIILDNKEKGQKDWKKLLNHIVHPLSQGITKCLYLILD